MVVTINHDYFVFQELESKLEASRLRESQLLAEVESVRFFKIIVLSTEF